jgi:hypothetical protein
MLNLNFQEGKYDGILVFLCFFGGAIAGYLLVNYSAIFAI